jgi:DNA-binding transcriptional ArsR family regulator
MPKSLPLLDDPAPICCAPLGEAPTVSDADALGLALRLKALGDPARIQLVSLLLAEPERGRCTRDLAPAVGLTEPTVSHHLRQLLDVGVVTKERRGMSVYYRPCPESVRAIARGLDITCC